MARCSIIAILLAAAPARAQSITGGVGAFAGLMPWSLGTDLDFGAHASLGVRLTDHVAFVATGQLLTAVVDNYNLENPLQWRRWVWSFGRPGFTARAAYALVGPLRAELSAAWFLIHDQYSGTEWWGHTANVALGLGAGF